VIRIRIQYLSIANRAHHLPSLERASFKSSVFNMRFQQMKPSYWITRIVFLRCLAFIYFVAFFVAWMQNEYLIGENGLTPAIPFVERVKKSVHMTPEGSQLAIAKNIMKLPTIFQYLSPSDKHLNLTSVCGMFLSLLVLILGSSNMLIMLILWVLYTSIVNIGQTWYSFGWESQILETGFLAIFLVPYFTFTHKYPKNLPTPIVCVWGYRWLLFRIMIGAGLIKIRGDSCWRDLTCMNYHYLTQPVPNPISHLFHSAPGIYLSVVYECMEV
jgi:hypothetical protein